jgi:4-phytase/acid phosphatase
VRNLIAKIVLLACLSALISEYSAAQAIDEAAVSNNANPQSTDRLKMVVILSRHGVRSPTWPQDRLDAYSASPWPKWSVPPGYLTSRGFELIKQFGNYDRTSLAEEDLFSATGCEDASKVYIWADTDQRTLESGRALAEGLFPGCTPAIHSLAPAKNDPLFHPHISERSSVQGGIEPVIAHAINRVGPGTQQDELLAEMQHVLWGCNPKNACTPVHTPALSLFGAPATLVRGKEDQMVESQDPLALSSSFAEDILLEYVDGMPMEQVGWGKVDEAQLREFLALHTANFARTHGTPTRAKADASNLLFHIMRTLQQGAEQHSVAGAVGPAGSKLMMLVGHDTNLAGVAALLGLHWTLDGRVDDTPPGTELAFELWQGADGAYFVQVKVTMQTLRQMREMEILTHATPPVQEVLAPVGCDNLQKGCRWKTFQVIVDRAIDKSYLAPVGELVQSHPK